MANTPTPPIHAPVVDQTRKMTVPWRGWATAVSNKKGGGGSASGGAGAGLAAAALMGDDDGSDFDYPFVANYYSTRGPRGFTGPKGFGTPGVDGVDGEDAFQYPPLVGKRGPQGIQGVAGNDGADGADGADATPDVVTVTATGNQGSLSCGTGAVRVVLLNNASLLTIQGIVAGNNGDRITFISINAQVDLIHQSGSAGSASERLDNRILGRRSLAANSGTATLIYNTTENRWRVVEHEQGAWILPTHADGDYTASGSMTWTVTSGDVNRWAYYLKGNTLHVELDVVTASVGGTASTQLIRALPAGYLYGGATSATWPIAVRNNTTYQVGTMKVSGGSLFFYVNATSAPSSANWTLSTNNMAVSCSIAFQIQ